MAMKSMHILAYSWKQGGESRLKLSWTLASFLWPPHCTQAKVKNEEGILRTAREKRRITDRGTPIGLSTAISAKTLQARMECYDTCKELKGKKTYNPARFSFVMKGEITSLARKTKNQSILNQS